jgi:hypothetical protein
MELLVGELINWPEQKAMTRRVVCDSRVSHAPLIGQCQQGLAESYFFSVGYR